MHQATNYWQISDINELLNFQTFHASLMELFSMTIIIRYDSYELDSTRFEFIYSSMVNYKERDFNSYIGSK